MRDPRRPQDDLESVSKVPTVLNMFDTFVVLPRTALGAISCTAVEVRMCLGSQ